MTGLNDRWFIFYWKQEEADTWQVSQPLTMGEIIEGGVELGFPDGGTLPLSDVDWGNDLIMYETVPARSAPPTTKEKET